MSPLKLFGGHRITRDFPMKRSVPQMDRVSLSMEINLKTLSVNICIDQHNVNGRSFIYTPSSRPTCRLTR